MNRDILSEYSQDAFTLIGLDLTNDQVLSLLNNQNTDKLKQIFITIDECENFLMKQNEQQKIVLIVSSYVLSDKLTKLQTYSQLDAIYSYTKPDDINGEFICIYKRPIEGKYKEIFFGLMKHLWFLIGLLIVLIFAYLFPDLGASDGPLHAKYSVKWGCVFFIFLLNSLSLSFKDLTDDLFNYRLHFSIQIYSLLIIPFIVFGIALLLLYSSINRYLIIGLILMGCMPTGTSINIISTKYAGGNECGTLLNILFGSILGIFISPLTIGFFMTISDLATVKQSFGIHYYLMIIGIISFTTLLPTFIGQIINYYWTDKITSIKTKFYFTEIIGILILTLVWTVLCDLFQGDLMKTLNKSDFLLIIMINALFVIFFTALAFFIAQLPVYRKGRMNNDHQPLLQENQSKSLSFIERWRFNRADTITFMFCGSTKTATSSILLIASVFSDYNTGFIGLMTLPLILYHIEQWILCSIEVIFLKRYF